MKILLSVLISLSLFACTKEKQASNVSQRPVEMVYELDVAEQDNVSYYVIQVSTDTKEWSDVDTITAEPNTFSMEHKYSTTIDVSRFYIKDTRFWQRTISIDNDGKYQISKITSVFFE